MSLSNQSYWKEQGQLLQYVLFKPELLQGVGLWRRAEQKCHFHTLANIPFIGTSVASGVGCLSAQPESVAHCHPCLCMPLQILPWRKGRQPFFHPLPFLTKRTPSCLLGLHLIDLKWMGAGDAKHIMLMLTIIRRGSEWGAEWSNQGMSSCMILSLPTWCFVSTEQTGRNEKDADKTAFFYPAALKGEGYHCCDPLLPFSQQGEGLSLQACPRVLHHTYIPYVVASTTALAVHSVSSGIWHWLLYSCSRTCIVNSVPSFNDFYLFIPFFIFIVLFYY